MRIGLGWGRWLLLLGLLRCICLADYCVVEAEVSEKGRW